ncbi:hypothetical protein, partial [Clostridium sp.]|uniref:hypothetical protein n=1 Tax=Clostridium sp. TaxID=1506 RepID=UPI00345DD2AA
ILGKKNGIDNSWSYFPDIRSLIGYIQYSFLQEAFYKLIYGQEKVITKIPDFTIGEIANEGEKSKKISREASTNMINNYEFIKELKDVSHYKVEDKLKEFIYEFNKMWLGSDKGFIYMKIFDTPEELGEFVISSALITNTKEELENILGMTISEWRDICKFATKDLAKGKILKTVLLKNLKDIY